MSTLILDQTQVQALLPMSDCINLMAEALRGLACGTSLNPLRFGVHPRGPRRLLSLMPAYLSSSALFGAKLITVTERAETSPYDSHQGLVILFDAETDIPSLICQGSAITAIRTAAVSAVATSLLAQPNAGDLAILGTGVQARAHLEAMSIVRKLRRIRVFSRKAEKRRLFCQFASDALGLSVETMASSKEAVEGADLICTTTPAQTPIVTGEWLAAGCHINAVGSCRPTARELDSEVMKRALLFVDSREAAEREAGDYLIPLREGTISDHAIVAELGDLLVSRKAVGRSPQDITVFKSLGLAVEDLAAAEFVKRKAEHQGIGLRVDLAGRI